MYRLLLPVLTLSLMQLISPSASAEVPDELLSSPLAAIFGAPPAIGSPRLSPDGSKLLFLRQDPVGITVVQVLEFSTGQVVGVAAGSERGYDIGWCDWVNATRIICDIVFAVDADGSNFLQIERGVERPQPHHFICGLQEALWATSFRIDWLPEEPDFISFICGIGQIRLNVYTGREDVDYMEPEMRWSDGHNFARLRRDIDGSPRVFRWYSRDSRDSEWTPLYKYVPQNFELPFMPLGFGENVNALYHFGSQDGHWALFARDLAAGDAESRLIYSHPLLDIHFVDAMGAHERIVAAAYLDGRPQRFVLDERVARAYQAASEILPEQSITVVDESWNGNVYLILARAARQAGVFYVMDLDWGTGAQIGAEYPTLMDIELAETRLVEFDAPDGGKISGHLTLPRDSGSSRGAVIIPRAYPTQLDIADPHYLAQFLAASGYAVLRVDYRGALELGPWLPDRSVAGWRQAAADIDTAVSYLVESGIAEDNQVCALGRDLGAYAAFMSAIEFPGRLACVVGIGIASDARSIIGTSMLIEQGGEFRDTVRDASPVGRAKEMTASALLFHAAYDDVVSISSSANLNRSLEREGKNTQFIQYPYDRHDIERAPYRIDMLSRISNFLRENLGQSGEAVR